MALLTEPMLFIGMFFSPTHWTWNHCRQWSQTIDGYSWRSWKQILQTYTRLSCFCFITSMAINHALLEKYLWIRCMSILSSKILSGNFSGWTSHLPSTNFLGVFNTTETTFASTSHVNITIIILKLISVCYVISHLLFCFNQGKMKHQNIHHTAKAPREISHAFWILASSSRIERYGILGFCDKSGKKGQ